MRAILAIFEKDFKTHVFTLSSFVILAIFALMTGAFLFSNVIQYHLMNAQLALHPELPGANLPTFSEAVIGPFLTNAALVLLLVVPVITMRLFSEEKRSGTLELLYTYPINDFQILIGKFLVVVGHLLLFMLPMLIDFIFLYQTARPIEMQVVWVAFAGFLTVAVSFASVGLFISSLTSNQMVSAIFTFGVLALWWSLGFIAHIFFNDAAWIQEVWIIGHLHSYSNGVMTFKTIIIYKLATLFFLFMTYLSIETRSWKQTS